ncbi:MAG: rhodanese-like domain-containing protein [Magnetococcales bacterium]|nr:rhodanese-like domain-containing protein [Magnetococcales bacterium]
MLLAVSEVTPVANREVVAEHLVCVGQTDPVLLRAQEEAAALRLGFAGQIGPQDAWRLFSSGQALLVDIRTAEERLFVGHVPGTLHVIWEAGTARIRNPRFVRELEKKTGKDAVILLLCRSAKRSAEAAVAVSKAGFAQVYNVLEGFEGDHNAQQQRGSFNGWRFHGLPWVQD